MANTTGIGTKTFYQQRPLIASNKKLIDTEFNRLVSVVDENYLRLVLKFSTDIADGQTLLVGQYVDQGDVLYRVITAHTVGTPKAFISGNYQAIGSTITPSTERSAATSKTITAIFGRTYIYTGSSDAVWTMYAVSGNGGVKNHFKNAGTAKLTLQKTGSDRLYTLEQVESIELYPGDSKLLDCDGTYIQVI